MEKAKSSILIVEDQKENIDLLRNILGREYQIRIAKAGGEAIRSVKAKQPDLILMDVGLPDMNGFEVLERIQEAQGKREIPVIFITAATREQDEKIGLELGAVDYIFKPYRPAIILNRVRNQLELSKYRKELEDEVVVRTAQLKETHKGLLTTLALATGYRHRETGEHILRTKRLVALLTDLLSPMFPKELTIETKEFVDEASLLHDIGKIAIPDSILLKPNTLTIEEMTIMKSHPIYGHDLLSEALEQFPHNKFLQVAIQMASYHHERWDGSGYPYGLKGDQIPLPARIMALVDVYDALTSDRVYRKSMSHTEAMNAITVGDGRIHPSHFDPTILSVFVENNHRFECLDQ